MPIFRVDNRVIYYAHVPKSGGTTVNRRLREAGCELAFFDGAFWTSGEKRWFRSSPQHIANRDRDLLFPDSFFDYSFTVVREPVARFLSAFNHNRSRIGHAVSFARFLDLLEKRVEDKGDYFGYRFDNHFLPASQFIPSHCDVFRLEDGLDRLFQSLRKELGLVPPNDVGTENARDYDVLPSSSRFKSIVKRLISVPSPKKAQLSAEHINRIERLYAEDIAAFYSDRAC